MVVVGRAGCTDVVGMVYGGGGHGVWLWWAGCMVVVGKSYDGGG